MATSESPNLAIVLTWTSDRGELSYETGLPVPEPMTRESVTQTAENVAAIVVRFLELEGMIAPTESKGDQ